MAGQPAEFLTGGSGMMTAPPAPNANGTVVAGGSGVQPHHSLIAIVLFAVLVLYALDKAGFRFAVTAGRR